MNYLQLQTTKFYFLSNCSITFSFDLQKRQTEHRKNAKQNTAKTPNGIPQKGQKFFNKIIQQTCTTRFLILYLHNKNFKKHLWNI